MTRRRVVGAFVVAALLFLSLWLRGCARRDPGTVAIATVFPAAERVPAALIDEVQLSTASGLELSCMMRRPAAATGRLPVVILAGGFRTGRRAAAIVGARFHGLAFACDYPWRNPGTYGIPRLVARLPRIRSELVSTPLAMRSAADWLRSHPSVDTARVAAVGASVGVPFVVAWAAADDRVGSIALLYGGAPLDDLLEVALRRSVRPASLRATLASFGEAALGPLRPERHAPGLWRRPSFVVIAVDDERVPAHLGEALAEMARGTVLRVAGRHLSADNATLLAMLTDSTVAWLEAVWGTGQGTR